MKTNNTLLQRSTVRATRSRRPALALVAVLISLALVRSGTAPAQDSGSIKIPDGYVQLEDDIIVTKANAALLLSQPDPTKNAVFAPSRLWPNRIVPYEFASDVTFPQQTPFLTAMRLWENSFPGVTTVRFQPRNGEQGYLRLVVGDPGGFSGGNTDFVGYYGLAVTITVSSDALNTFLIAHEMGHALGLWHEQSRIDRDSFVTVVGANIQDGKGDQFDKRFPQFTFFGYDYDSIMHYSPCSFSKCAGLCTRSDPACATIQVVPQYSSQQSVIGQRSHLSAMDQRVMAFRYGPPSWKFLSAVTGAAGDNGSFEQPYTSAAQAATSTPANSTLWLCPGAYPAAGVVFRTPMTLKAAIPDLRLQPNGSLGPSPSGYATLR